MGRIVGFLLLFFLAGPAWSDVSSWDKNKMSDEILSPKQQKNRARREAFHKKTMTMSYGDLEEAAQSNKRMARFLKKLNKKGITNAAHYEQFKARKKGQMGRQMYPRGWKKAGKGRDDIYKRHTQEIQ